MERKRSGLATPTRAASLLSLLLLAACGTTTPTSSSATVGGSLTVTAGAEAPSTGARLKPLSEAVPTPDATATGTNTATVRMSGCAGTTTTQTLVYRVSGKQGGTATVTFPTTYSLDNGVWVASGSQTVNVPVSPATFSLPVTLQIGAVDTNGDSSVTVAATNVTNSNKTGSKLAQPGNATIAVSLSCAVKPPEPETLPNTAPALTVPADLTVEATGVTTPVDFAAQLAATDTEEGDLSAAIACTPASGAAFALGTTTVTCSVSDTGKRLRTDGTPGTDGDALTTTASFNVTVQDTTPPALTVPAAPVTVAASGMSGTALDFSALGVSAGDLVDGALSPVCTPASLPIGLNQTVTCTATDAAGNSSSGSFMVNVTFASPARSLLQPVNDTRNGAALSAFKAGSTIPLKFLPPTFAGGDAATGLASGLKLVVTTIPASGSSVEEETTDLSSGSTVWRYDATSGQYIFNLSTKNVFFKAGSSYRADISYQGVAVASSDFRMK